MPPAAASYVRRHPCLTPVAMTKWQVGVLPMDGGGDKRGFSLRGHVIYHVYSDNGKILAWAGRDPNVVEGFNDVINLDTLGIPAVAIMSNRITETQVAKITAWAKQLGNNKVTLLFDCEPTGDEGAKEAIWLFAQLDLFHRVAARCDVA